MALPIYEGTITSWFQVRNFGFICPDNSIPGCDMELFFHVSDLFNGQPIPKNTRVSFQTRLFKGRYKAINVTPIAHQERAPGTPEVTR